MLENVTVAHVITLFVVTIIAIFAFLVASIYLFIPDHRGDFTITNTTCYGSSITLTITNLDETRKDYTFEIEPPKDYVRLRLGPNEQKTISISGGRYAIGENYYVFDRETSERATFICETSNQRVEQDAQGIVMDFFLRLRYVF